MLVEVSWCAFLGDSRWTYLGDVVEMLGVGVEVDVGCGMWTDKVVEDVEWMLCGCVVLSPML